MLRQLQTFNIPDSHVLHVLWSSVNESVIDRACVFDWVSYGHLTVLVMYVTGRFLLLMIFMQANLQIANCIKTFDCPV